LIGGLCASAVTGGNVSFVSWKQRSFFKGLKAVVAVPAFELSTAKARSVLPKTVSKADAVFNVSRAALFLSALAAGRRELLGAAMEDRLHQPYRSKLVPGLTEAIAGARKAGAHGAALSGAGPCVLALAPAAKAAAAGKAMENSFKKKGISSRALVLDVDFGGAKAVR
jgi:homoserine kinase